MKKWTIGLCFCALLAAAFCTASCEKYALPKLEIDNDTIQAPIAGGTFDVKLTSNVRWMMDGSAIPEWIYIDVKDGRSNYVDTVYNIKVKVRENEEAARQAVILITTMTLSHKLVVEQEGVEVTPEPENPENQDES